MLRLWWTGRAGWKQSQRQGMSDMRAIPEVKVKENLLHCCGGSCNVSKAPASVVVSERCYENRRELLALQTYPDAETASHVGNVLNKLTVGCKSILTRWLQEHPDTITRHCSLRDDELALVLLPCKGDTLFISRKPNEAPSELYDG